MSDTWYRDPAELPPFEDGFGQLWTLDGCCLNPKPEPPLPDWLATWPDDLQFVAMQAAVSMELADEYWRLMELG